MTFSDSEAARIVARFHTQGEAAWLDHRKENGRHKIDADVRLGGCEILAGSLCGLPYAWAQASDDQVVPTAASGRT